MKVLQLDFYRKKKLFNLIHTEKTKSCRDSNSRPQGAKVAALSSGQVGRNMKVVKVQNLASAISCKKKLFTEKSQVPKFSSEKSLEYKSLALVSKMKQHEAT